MSYSSNAHANRQDRARTAFSNKSLAKGRRTKVDDPDALRAEQAAYARRFPTPNRKPIVIHDINGNYPDQHLTPRQS